MSLLANLLSKVAPGKAVSGIPPTLRTVVLESSRKRTVRLKTIIVSGVALLFVVIGLVIVRFLGHPTDTVQRVAPGIGPVQSEETPMGPRSTERVITADPLPKSDRVGSTDATRFADQSPPKAARPDQEAKPRVEGPRAISSIAPSRTAVPEPRENPPTSAKAVGPAHVDRRAEADEALYAARSSEAAGDREQALRYYRKAAELGPGNYIVMNKIASILIAKGSFKEAADYARASLGVKADYAPSLVNLGICCIQTFDNDGGIVYLRKALSVDPSNSYALLNLGLVHEKSKNYDEARNVYSILAGLKDARGYLGVARVSEVTGRTDEARKAYRDILALEHADGHSTRLATERLQALGD